MYKIFDTLEQYNQFTDNGTNLTSGVTYYVKEDSSSHFQTNNIDGEEKVYNMMVNEDLINLIERDITTFNIPSGTTKIGNYAFFFYRNLTSITIPDSVTNIGTEAFQGCTSLTSVTIPNSVTSIDDSAFQDCSVLTSVTIGSGVTSIGNNVFYNCIKLTSITIPDSVLSIGNQAFQACSSLTSITIPSSVTSIGVWTFRNCSGLTSVTVKAVTPPTLGFSSFDGTNNCPIYVPAETVDAYKAATNWKTYASRIQPIPTE